MLAAEVTTPVPSISNELSNYRREKLPAVLACLRCWLWGLEYRIIKKMAKTLRSGCRTQISLYLSLEPVMSGYLYSIVYRIYTAMLSRVADEKKNS